jgi:uncharacterized membrane protein
LEGQQNPCQADVEQARDELAAQRRAQTRKGLQVMNKVQRYVPPDERTTLGLSERAERVLAYAIPIVSGLVLWAVEKNPTVRRHAKQSVVVFTPIFLLWGVLALLSGLLGLIPFIGLIHILPDVVAGLVKWVGIIIWVLLMVMAFFLPDLVFFGDKKQR